MAKTCPNCGKESTKPNARFCAGCGDSLIPSKTVRADPQYPTPPPQPVAPQSPPQQSPTRRRIPMWIWIVGAIGVLLISAACGALAVFGADAAGIISVLPAEEEPLPTSTSIPEEPTQAESTATLTPTPTPVPPSPTPRPTATPRPSATPRPTATPLPTNTPAPTRPPATAAPTPVPSTNGTIYLSSETTNAATCRISVWGNGNDFLMDAGPGSPNSRVVPAGEYGWQVFFGPSGQTAGMSMNLPPGGACSFTCYDEYVSWGCGY